MDSVAHKIKRINVSITNTNCDDLERLRDLTERRDKTRLSYGQIVTDLIQKELLKFKNNKK